MEIEVLKIAESKDSTFSQMRIDGQHFCFVVEDGYRKEKVAGQTRIPDGRYKIAKRTVGGFFAKYRQRFGHAFAIEILDVPGFKDILIHTGNTDGDTRGCLLVGDIAGRTGINYAIAPGWSTPAYKRLYDVVESAFAAGQEVWIALARDGK